MNGNHLGCWLINLENGDVVSFKNVVGDNIFMVADVTDNGALRYLTAPFLCEFKW